MLESAKSVPVGKRVRLAMLEASDEFDGNVTSYSSSSQQRAKNSRTNLSHTWKSKTGLITMTGIGKGNSNWELQIVEYGLESTYKFKSIEDFIQNSMSRIHQGMISPEVVQKIRFLCRAVSENEYKKNTGNKKEYDVVRWRRAKKTWQTAY